jgi:hypothetical protein
MAQQDCERSPILFVGRINKRTDRFFIVDLNVQFLGFVRHQQLNYNSLASIDKASCNSLLKRFATPACTLGELLPK